MYKKEYYYLAIDGDDVGKKIEFYILSNKMDKLTSFSTQYKEAMKWLQRILTIQLKSQIIFSGGDSIFLKIPVKHCDISLVEQISLDFKKKSQCSISMGIGDSTIQAYLALKFAKVSGKDCLKSFRDIPNNQ